MEFKILALVFNLNMVVIIAEQDSESLSDALKCQNIEYTVSWTNKNEELRTVVQKLSEIDLPGNKFGPKNTLIDFYKKQCPA